MSMRPKEGIYDPDGIGGPQPELTRADLIDALLMVTGQKPRQAKFKGKLGDTIPCDGCGGTRRIGYWCESDRCPYARQGEPK